MAQTQTLPDTAAPLVERWESELHALHSAGDFAELTRQRDSHAQSAVNLLLKGAIVAAEQFASLARVATDLLATPRVRVLTRRAEVTEQLMELDA